jgi:hypothetical protein
MPSYVCCADTYRRTINIDRPTPNMNRLPDDLTALVALLKPETALERSFLEAPEFRHGLLWGEPRFGHPEGQVALHVREVLDNIDKIPGLSSLYRTQLRLIAWSHDTFKYAEDRSRPRDWSKHHGILARRFMEKYTQDEAVLDIIAFHDDAYYAWLNARHDSPQADMEQKSLKSLFAKIGYCIQLYYLFFKCDTQTGDKTQASLKWFEKNIEGIEYVRIREQES